MDDLNKLMLIRKDCYFLALLAITPFFFLSGTLTSSNTFFMRDLTYLFHPWRTLSAQMMQAGEMPLWNSYEMGGMPFLANCQSAILYPFTILFYFFHFTLALKIFHFFHYALAAIGFYLFSRRLGFNGWIAFAGSMVFSYNGYMLTRLEFLSALGSLIWFPWIAIFLIPHYENQPPFIPSLLSGLVISFAFFAGYPQVLVLEIGAAFLFCFIMRGFKTTLSIGLGTLMVFLLISAVQWIPTLELWKHSVRSGNGIALEEAAAYSMPLGSLLGLIYPFRILHHADRFTGEKFFWIWSAWWGLTATFISFFAVKFRNKKLLLLSCFFIFSGILWAMGSQFPWYEILYQYFSPVRLFRYPPAVLYLTVVGICFLVLCGLSVLDQKIKKWGMILMICLLSVELWTYSRHHLPTITPDYFRYTFGVIRRLQEDVPGFVMLSPKLDRDRKLTGVNSLHAALKFRGYLFDLTNLPYRIKTLINSGEPLALLSYQQLYTQLMQTPVFHDARKYFNFWNVTHFLTTDTLDKTWTGVAMDNHLKVYRNPHALGEVFALRRQETKTLIPKQVIRADFIRSSNSGIMAKFITAEDLIAIFNVPYFPGWKAFILNRTNHITNSVQTFKIQDYFTAVQLPSGNHRLFLIYQPGYWKLAVSITLLSILIFSVIGYQSLKVQGSKVQRPQFLNF